MRLLSLVEQGEMRMGLHPARTMVAVRSEIQILVLQRRHLRQHTGLRRQVRMKKSLWEGWASENSASELEPR